MKKQRTFPIYKLTDKEQKFVTTIQDCCDGISNNSTMSAKLGWTKAQTAKIAGQLLKKNILLLSTKSKDSVCYELIAREEGKSFMNLADVILLLAEIEQKKNFQEFIKKEKDNFCKKYNLKPQQFNFLTSVIASGRI